MAINGAINTSYQLHLNTNTDKAGFLVTRNTANTTGARIAYELRLISTGVGVDGLGPAIQYQYQDSGGALSPLGFAAVVRDGADNSGSFEWSPSDAGSQTLAMDLDSNGTLSVYRGGIVGDAQTGDPCAGAGFPEGAIFYNDTSNYYCYCDGTNDVQLHDPATACF